MDGWRAEADKAIRLALAPSTRKSYACEGSQFHTFRRQEGLLKVWPIPVSQLMHFCVSLRGKGMSVGSIQGKLAALAFASKAMGFSDRMDNFCLRKMLEGWSRESGVPWDARFHYHLRF